MTTLARKVQLHLLNIQEPFKQELLDKLTIFKEDEEMFHKDFKESGPTYPGLSAKEASNRFVENLYCEQLMIFMISE